MEKCIICQKKLEQGEKVFCKSCDSYYHYANSTEGFDYMLEQYEEEDE